MWGSVIKIKCWVTQHSVTDAPDTLTALGLIRLIIIIIIVLYFPFVHFLHFITLNIS